MKVLYLTTGCFDKGGVSRYSRYQIGALRELYGKENIKVLSVLGPGQDSFEEPFEVTWYGSGSNFKSKSSLSLQALKITLSWRPDLIHSAHINLSALAHSLAKLIGATSVLNTYGLEVWSGFSRTTLWGLTRIDYVISDCYFTAKYLEEQRLRPENSIEVIWDCVNLDTFTVGAVPGNILRKYKLWSPDDFFVILTLGRISQGARHKGYERLVEVFEKVARVNEKARLVFVGGGDFVDHLKELVEEKALTSKVQFTGRVTEDELRKIYRCGTVFSLVSDRGKGRGEGIPLTPLEAMACGIPIVVGNHDGSQEAVFDEKNGWVIDPFDLDRHAEILIELSTNENLLNSKRQGALTVAKEKFSFREFVQKHKMFYSKVINPT